MQQQQQQQQDPTRKTVSVKLIVLVVLLEIEQHPRIALGRVYATNEMADVHERMEFASEMRFETHLQVDGKI